MELFNTDLLVEAYLSIKKDSTTPSSVSVGPMEEPAPGIEANVVDANPNINSTNNTSSDVSLAAASPDVSSQASCSNGCDLNCNCSTNGELDQETEEDQIVIDNLNSIKESIMKIASFCASGGHLEAWAQQNLSIVMDKLAEIARRQH